MSIFNLIQGVTVNDIKDIHNCYEKQNNENLFCTLSAELLKPLAISALKALKSPVFFFLEVPYTEDEEKALKSTSDDLHKNTYYFDNCTTDVALAIIKRYGEILFNDGLIEFGFGSHVDNSEIYFRKYQIVQIYSPEISDFEKCLNDLDSSVPLEKDIKTLWDVFDEKNYGQAVSVEVNGETVYDIIDNLSEVGLYKADS